ncbi:MAG TPA: PhzF family phenazine biosynthesis protein [Acetobacteraceae bacterium]|nr:PhzF family phenazine biosynthesis protein [Acetobacteraceae bacterium]
MTEKASVEYVTLDVFTDHPFGGNPLAVVLDGRGLADAEMQAIATEFNYSETTFLLPPEDALHTARVRIFTTIRELPFAGHPNVGTGFVVAGLGALFGREVGEELLFEEKAGLVPIAVLKEGGAVVGARLTAPQTLAVGRTVAPEIVAECLGLDTSEIATDHHPPVIASVGLPFLFAALTSRASLAKCRPSSSAFARHLPIEGARAIHASVREGTSVHARVVADHGTIIEDPATGSANVAFVALAADLVPEPDAELSLDIVQGVEMGRPSRLAARAVKRARRVERAEIGGRCVPVMRGRLSFVRAG